MELKTKVNAEEGKQDVAITREFDLPVSSLYEAYIEPSIIEQWMGTKVLKHESRSKGSYEFETRDTEGKVVFKASGVLHTVIPEKKIIRTFEMENAPFGVQLEIYEFEPLGEAKSKLKLHVVYESGALRDQLLKFGYAAGLSMAHDRLEAVAKK